MKPTLVSALATLALPVLSSNLPNLQHDPYTTKDCVEWYDVLDNATDTCEATLRYWGINPELFHAWNPSVGLDCTPWHNWTSYCIVTQERLDNSVHYTTLSDGLPLALLTTDASGWTIAVTKSDAVTATSTGYEAGPLPTAWEEVGCYQDTEEHVFDMRFGPDEELTAEKCKEKCWPLEYKYAGVQNGDQCWCSHTLGAELAADQKACNIPCFGDNATMCGGNGTLSVFHAVENKEAGSGAAASTTAGVLTLTTQSAARSSVAGEQTATPSSGAGRSKVMFWRMLL